MKVFIRSTTPSFRRAGIAFTRAGAEFDTRKFKAGVLEILREEPRLDVVDVVDEKPAPPAAPVVTKAAAKTSAKK